MNIVITTKCYSYNEIDFNYFQLVTPDIICHIILLQEQTLRKAPQAPPDIEPNSRKISVKLRANDKTIRVTIDEIPEVLQKSEEIRKSLRPIHLAVLQEDIGIVHVLTLMMKLC